MDKGEPSRKSTRSGGDGQRPLKKAKFVWQVKGKYHLKGNNQQQANSINTNTDGMFMESDTDSEHEPAVNNNNNIPLPSMMYNNNMQSSIYDTCCMDTILMKSSALLERAEEEGYTNNIDQSILEEIPITLVKPSLRNEDDFMNAWQARQVAKSFVDNTINSILEHWRIAAFVPEDFVEDCENGEQVEDEGIMMAIQSHGLQSGPRFDNPEDMDAQMDELEPPLQSVADPMNFLNTAISAAIQKKGLSSN